MATRGTVSRRAPSGPATRRAGTLVVLAALGLLTGTGWMILVQPTRYRAEARAVAAVTPASAANAAFCESKRQEWLGILRDAGGRALLENNLRHALKLAVTRDLILTTDRLSDQLAQFVPGISYSSALLPDSVAARLGPSVTIRLEDLPENMDFQSLAAVVSDLDPPADAEDWDFSFFTRLPIIAAGDGLVAGPGPDDRYFRVFYRLHALVAGREASSPVEAWKSAVDVLAERLDREARFAGGGGFGHTAKRELVREIASVPALAANGLYFDNNRMQADADGREEENLRIDRWIRNIDLRVFTMGAGQIAVEAEMTTDLYPLRFPRDTVLTRLPPMALATLFSFLAAGEGLAVAEPATESAPPSPEAGAAAAAEPAPVVSYREEVDESAARERADAIARLEVRTRTAAANRDDALRRLDIARANEARLDRETAAARARADRLRERRDDAALAAARDMRPNLPPETAALFAKRDALFKRLTELLDYCTDEHPFVKQARRELEATENLLAAHDPDPNANREAEVRATRLAVLELECEAAEATAESLEERLRVQGEAVCCLLDEVANLDRELTRSDLELARAKGTPVPTVRRPVRVASAAPAPAPPPPRVAAPAAGPVRLAFAPAPGRIPLRAARPSWAAPLLGLLAGLILAGLWLILRGLFASRVDSPASAARLTRLPVLAALPAFDPASFRAAAAGMKGDLRTSGHGRLGFTPAPVEIEEPPPVARRGAIRPALRRARVLPWILAAVFLAATGLLLRQSRVGFARPAVGFSGELPLPAETVRGWADEDGKEEEWGDLP